MNIRNTSELVKSIMTANKSSRSDDFTLYGFVLNKYGYSVSTPFLAVAMAVKDNVIPSMETVGRCRRRVQELYPELQAVEKVQSNRDELQLDYVEFVKDKRI